MNTTSSARGISPRRLAPRAATDISVWQPPRGGWIAIGAVLILYAAHLAYGALYDAAFVMGFAAAVLVAIALTQPAMRADLLRLKSLTLPLATFLIVLLVGIWSLTPWAPGGAHPVWGYVGISPGASTIDRSATIGELVKLLGLACLFVVGLFTGGRDERARYAVRLTLLAGLPFGLWAFIAAATGTIYQSQGHRLEARFLNPNTAGTMFAVLVLLALTELVRQLRNRSRRQDSARLVLAGAVVLTFAICLLATASRGAMMALLGGGLVFIVVQLATGALKVSRALIGVLIAMAALLLVVAVAGDQLLDRLFQSQESAIVRGEIWNAHWRAFLDSPLFGYGLGTAETVNKTLISPSNYELLWNIRAILNVYLQWLEEAGLVGAIPMFATTGLLILATVKSSLGRSRMTVLLAGLLGVDAIFLLHGATDFGLQVPSLAGLWAWLLGLQFALAQGSSRR